MKYVKSKQLRLKSLSESREQKAKAILEKGEPQLLDEFTYLVPSQFSNKKYKVTHLDSYSCSCKDFEYKCKSRGLYCKHIKAILLFQEIKARYEVKPEIEREIEYIIKTPKKDCCPYCQSEKLIRRGVRKTKLGEKQRYSCGKCKKRCVLSPIKRIKGNPKLVCLAMDCFYRGLSFRDISDQFEQFYSLSISHETIRNWVRKFIKVIDKYAKTIQPKIKGAWNADEILVLSKRGNKKKDNKNFDYVWNVLDNKSKFLLASKCSGRSRKSEDAQKVMTEAYKQNGKIPYQIITDRYRGYQGGISKTFKNWGNERKVKHTSIVGKRKYIDNNAIESHHSHQKEFHRIRRGVTKVQDYQDGFKIFHNFVRKGVKDKKTPAERCGIGDLSGWEPLLFKSLQKVPHLTPMEKIIGSPED